MGLLPSSSGHQWSEMPVAAGAQRRTVTEHQRLLAGSSPARQHCPRLFYPLLFSLSRARHNLLNLLTCAARSEQVRFYAEMHDFARFGQIVTALFSPISHVAQLAHHFTFQRRRQSKSGKRRSIPANRSRRRIARERKRHKAPTEALASTIPWQLTTSH